MVPEPRNSAILARHRRVTKYQSPETGPEDMVVEPGIAFGPAHISANDTNRTFPSSAARARSRSVNPALENNM